MHRLCAGARGVIGHERINANEQLCACLQRRRSVQGLLHRAVDIITTVDARRRIEARQSGACLDRLRNRHVVEARRAERRRLAAVELGGDDEELAAELAEIIGCPGWLKSRDK